MRNTRLQTHEIEEEKLALQQTKARTNLERSHAKAVRNSRSEDGDADVVAKNQEEMAALVSEQVEMVRF